MAKGLVFANGPGDQGSTLWYLMSPCLTLSIIRYGPRVSGAILGKEWHPPLHFGVVATERGTFGSPLTIVGQLILIYVYICKGNSLLVTIFK